MKISNNELLAQYVPNHEELSKIVGALKTIKQKIVLTQGTWDMVHTGHIRYLEQAKAAGDILIVAVDSDRLTKERKGPKRPFDPEDERIAIIRALRSVDIVTFKDSSSDMLDVLKVVSPDVFVISMGTGPEIQNHIGEFKKYAKEILNLPPQSSTTTTAKLRRLQGDVIDAFEADLISLVKNFKNKMSGEERK